METGDIGSAEGEVLDVLSEESVVKGEQILFRVARDGEGHSAVVCDFDKWEALRELDHHVFKVTALDELRPKRNAGACSQDAQAGGSNIEIGHAADPCG
jgi:hypothetical protein